MRSLWLCVFALSLLTTSEAQDSDLTGKVYGLLADYQINCEALRAEPWAFVGKGESIGVKKGKVTTKDLWYVGCKQGDNSLVASSATYGSSTGKYREAWNQRFESKHGVLLRYRIYTDRTPVVLNQLDEEEKKRALRRISRMDPFDQVFGTASSLSIGGKTRRNNWEKFLSEECELLKGNFDDDGNVVAAFNLGWQIPTTVRIVFGKKHQNLPIDVRWRVVVPNGSEVQLSHQLIKWKKKRSDTWVPIQLKANSTQPSGATTSYSIDFDWRIGKEVPSGVIARSMPDWRENIRTLFDVDWQRQGVTPPNLIPE